MSKNMLKEFKEFAVKGNVIDLAVGVVIGTAFGKIVSSFVSDVIMPSVGVLTGGVNFADLKIILKKTAEGTAAVTLNYGAFINTIIDFLIISSVIFIVVKQFERFRKKEEKKPVNIPDDVKLLKEIRDILKDRKSS